MGPMSAPSCNRWLGPLGPVLVAAALLAAACGELEAPAAYSPTTSSTVPVEPEQEDEVDTAPPTQSVQLADEFFPGPDPSYVPSLLVSGDQPVFAVDGLESIPLGGALDGLEATRVHDDLVGGVVVQAPDGSIEYRQAQGQNEALPASGTTLLDVGFWEGSPRAFVKSAPGRVDWIQLVTDDSGVHERRTHFELDEGEEVVAFSASGDIQAVVVQDAGCGEMRFYGSDGELLALRGPEPPPCTFPGRPSFGAVALSPDGGAVAYTIVTYRDDGTEQVTELTARELLADAPPFFQRRIGEDLDVISSLTYDGARVAYVRSSGGGQSVGLLDLTTESELAVDLLAVDQVFSVAFTRVPLELIP